MKYLAKRILTLLCTVALLLTCVMTLTSCEPKYSVEEYEAAFKLAYELQYPGDEYVISNMDDFELTDVFWQYGNFGCDVGAAETLYAMGEEYCVAEVCFRNYHQSVATLVLVDMPYDLETAPDFFNSFPSEAVRIMNYGYEDQGYYRYFARITVEDLSEKDKIRLYKVCLDRCLQDYPDLMESITSEQ